MLPLLLYFQNIWIVANVNIILILIVSLENEDKLIAILMQFLSASTEFIDKELELFFRTNVEK